MCLAFTRQVTAGMPLSLSKVALDVCKPHDLPPLITTHTHLHCGGDTGQALNHVLPEPNQHLHQLLMTRDVAVQQTQVNLEQVSRNANTRRCWANCSRLLCRCCRSLCLLLVCSRSCFVCCCKGCCLGPSCCFLLAFSCLQGFLLLLQLLHLLPVHGLLLQLQHLSILAAVRA